MAPAQVIEAKDLPRNCSPWRRRSPDTRAAVEPDAPAVPSATVAAPTAEPGAAGPLARGPGARIARPVARPGHLRSGTRWRASSRGRLIQAALAVTRGGASRQRSGSASGATRSRARSRSSGSRIERALRIDCGAVPGSVSARGRGPVNTLRGDRHAGLPHRPRSARWSRSPSSRCLARPARPRASSRACGKCASNRSSTRLSRRRWTRRAKQMAACRPTSAR